MPVDRLPAPLRPAAYRLRSALLTDGTALVIAGLMALVKGITDFGRPYVVHPFEQYMPIEVWGVVWLIVGICSIVSAARPNTWPARISFGLLVGLFTLWGLSYGIVTITGGPNLGGSTTLYLGVAALIGWSVWRGSRRGVCP